MAIKRFTMPKAVVAASAAASLLLTTPVGINAKDTAKGTVLEGEHYVVRMDFDDATLAKTVLEVAETAWTHTLAFFDLTSKAPHPKLDVHIYGTVKAFQSAEKKLTRGRFAKSLAFTHHDTRSCHCTLVPGGDRTLQRTLGISEHFLRQVGHEASHAASYVLYVNYRSHPDWLAEGVATHIAERIAVERKWTADVSASPFYGMRIVNCKTLRHRGLLPEPRAIVQDELRHLPTDRRYSVWWSFFRFLVERYKKPLGEILKEARALGGGHGYTSRLYDIVRKHFDDKALDALNDEYRGYIDALAAEWSEPHRSLEVRGLRWTQMAYPQTNAVAWQHPARAADYRVTGQVTIASSKNPQANVLVGGTEAGFYSIAFRAASGVTIFEHVSRGNRWNKLKHEPHAFPTGKPISFDIRVDGDMIDVGFGGEHRLNLRVARPLAGRIGVGVQAGGGATWQGVRVRK